MSFPFKSDNVLNYQWSFQWNDNDTGGNDWSIWKCVNPPPGYARLGDIPNVGHGPISVNTTQGRNMLFVSDAMPYAKPCDDFSLAWFIQGYYWTYGWTPVSNDPDYIGVGLAFTNNPNIKPKTSDYYVINKALVKTAGNGGAPGVWYGSPYVERNGGDFYFNFDGQLLFSLNPNRYLFYSLSDMQATCTGRSSNFSYASPGSPFCSTLMKANCSSEDVKVTGKCSSWCEADPKNCDAIKVDYCAQHPADTWCDCINAATRPSYITEQSMLSAEGKNAPRPCRTTLCRDRTIDTDAFVLSSDVSLLKNCPDINYTDQSVNISGSNNVATTSQAIGKDGSAAPPDSTILGLKPGYFYLLLLFILIIIYAIVSKMYGGESAPAPVV